MTTTTQPAPEVAPAMGIRDVLRFPAMYRLWVAQDISDIGDAFTSLGLLLVVNQLTGSTTALALMAVVLAVPGVVFGVFAGAWVDRLDRRRVMIASDLVRAVLVLGFVVAARADRLWLLYLLAFGQATVGTFFTPARTALMPHLVPRSGLLAANSLMQATRLVAGVLGAAGVGVLVSAAGVTWPAFVLDSGSFLCSAVLVTGIAAAAGRVTHTSGTDGAPATVGSSALRAARPSILAASLEGIHIVAASRMLVATFIGIGVVMLGLGAVNVLFVPLLINELQVPPAWFGAIELAQASSMILSALLVARLFSRWSPQSIVSIGLAGLAVPICLLAGVSQVWQVVVLLFAVGWLVTPIQAGVTTIVQTATEDATRGRVAALLGTVTGTANIVSMAFGGMAAAVIGVGSVFLLSGLLVAAAAALVMLLYRDSATESRADRTAAVGAARLPVEGR